MSVRCLGDDGVGRENYSKTVKLQKNILLMMRPDGGGGGWGGHNSAKLHRCLVKLLKLDSF